MTARSWLWVAGATVALMGAKGCPPKCPDTCPPASACTDPAKGCQPIPAPGLVCECPTGGPCCECWHWPEGATEWQLAKCPEGQTCNENHQCEEPAPPTTCPEQCPPGTACTDPAVGCVPVTPPGPSGCVPPDSGDSRWSGAGRPTPEPRRDVLLAAIGAVGDRCGHAAPDERPQYESLRMVAEQLRARGVCAGQWADSVLYLAPDNVWAQHHAVAFGNGCLLTGDGPNVYEGTWAYSGDGPTSDTCPDPRPLLTPDAVKLVCREHGSLIDCTRTTNMQCDFCASIGMGEMGGITRCGCPFRKPGHPEALACDALMPLVLQSRNGASCVRRGDTMFEPNGQNCRLCNEAGTVCSEWY